jgi:group I intron endonuclease
MRKRNPIICGVYKISNGINGNFYIGSSKNILNRWQEHKYRLERGLNKCKGLQNAWDKYGKENFTFEILETCSIEELIPLEQTYLDQLNPAYNMCSKANVPLGMNGKKHSQQTRKLQSESAKNSWDTERKKKMSSMMTGENHPMFGRKQSDTFKIAAKKRMDKKWSDPVLREEFNKTRIGIKRPNFSARISGVNNPMYGKSGELSPNFGRKQSAITIEKRASKIRRPVLKIDIVTGLVIDEYPSLTEAGKAVSTSIAASRNINGCVRNRLKTAYGFKWRYKY